MKFKDASAAIESVAQNYKWQEMPSWIVKLQELLQQLSQAFQEFWDSLFHLRNPGASDSTALSAVIQYGIYIVGFMALLALCAVLWRRAAKRAEEVSATRRGATAVEKILNSTGYKQEAEELAAQKNFRAACRSLYLCLLQYLHERMVVVFAPAKTNYEYRYLLAEFSALQKGFVKLAEIVEQTWFGNRQAEESDFSECLALVQQSEEEIDKIAAARLARESEHA